MAIVNNVKERGIGGAMGKIGEEDKEDKRVWTNGLSGDSGGVWEKR